VLMVTFTKIFFPLDVVRSRFLFGFLYARSYVWFSGCCVLFVAIDRIDKVF
jgi:hypothetical protein